MRHRTQSGASPIRGIITLNYHAAQLDQLPTSLISACDCGVRCGPRTPAGPVGAGAARRKSVSAHTRSVARRVGGDARRHAPPAQSARAASQQPDRTDGTRRENRSTRFPAARCSPSARVWRCRRRRRSGRTSVARSSPRVKMPPQADHRATAWRPGTEDKRGPRICSRRRIFSAADLGARQRQHPARPHGQQRDLRCPLINDLPTPKHFS
jgi:hypothetical protein